MQLGNCQTNFHIFGNGSTPQMISNSPEIGIQGNICCLGWVFAWLNGFKPFATGWHAPRG
jgi:hypothetical protein